jgi:quercetin dioxygenase-like cupin family protein
MEEKSNKATQQRPEGDRVLYAPLIDVDLHKHIKQLRTEAAWKESDRDSITIYKSHSLCIVLVGLHQGAELKTHKVNGIISLQILDGNIKFLTEQQIIELHEGQMIILEEKLDHSIVAIKETFFLLTLNTSETFVAYNSPGNADFV